MDKIAIIGLGYVGLPLAVEFGKVIPTVGFDINKKRISDLREGKDFTKEVEKFELQSSKNLTFTFDSSEIADATIYIVTVPTPIDSHNNPDLTPLIKASETVGKLLNKGDLVIYESTVFPGCTEDVCVPVLEKHSELKFNIDFYCGYSPERINPGDKEHRLPTIKKVTSGSTVKIAERVDELYKKIITAGTYKASSIKVAEAAKVIENSQRDLNIAFVNELALIFDKVGIDTHEVLEAAGTKWNFLPFKPGLVGGHCIGVDPYYLTYKAESLGYNPQVILAGRRINDNMGVYVANKVIKLMANNDNPISKSRILVLGITFKENCPDIRNSKVIDVIDELKEFGAHVEVYDPEANTAEVKDEYGIELIDSINGIYNAIILAVGHSQFKSMDLKEYTNDKSVIYDVKAYLEPSIITDRL